VSVCSVESAAVGEPLPGTAPFARGWIVVEHPAPWGRDALADNRLPPEVQQHLRTAKSHGVTVLLARHPDRPERTGPAGTHVWVARPAAGGMLLRHALMHDLAPLAFWDLEALASGSLPALGTTTPTPLLLVCTHSRRDRCCAVNGRALMTDLLAARGPEARAQVWECSHIGGHRFAPVTLTLPSGTVHGRVTSAEALLDAVDHGSVLLPSLRGRSSFPPPLQAAEIAVRQAVGITAVDDLDVLRVVGDRVVPPAPGVAESDAQVAEVRHRDGRAWRVEVRLELPGTARAESCGAEQLPVRVWTCSPPVPTPAWS
jgi:hypothetical protein